ncbi:MAG: hypothetical protein AUK47_27615 [Deltaproteobacteria bacterium CG2_30_63_29]|nr:MAG: hypothetical protein AUK47_27615 [Deltaproteobacteria bacterium CG2_30_63_29]
MANRTFAIGDIHGDLGALNTLLDKLPELDRDDTLVFLGDYLDRGPHSAQVINKLRVELPESTPAKVVTLMGNHEEAWLKVSEGQMPNFVLHAGNGCLACYRSFLTQPGSAVQPSIEELKDMLSCKFFPEPVFAWMKALPYWYEDEHAIYVHAGIQRVEGEWVHPSKTDDPSRLLWLRSKEFYRFYNEKRVIVGHTPTQFLPPNLSSYTPDVHDDMWVNESVHVIDTGCGKGGFLTALELPSVRVYESRGGA